MKAVQFDRHGGSEVLTLTERETPACGPGEVRVAMRAVGVNPVDAKIRAGAMAGIPKTFPAVTGRDGAGVVTHTGDGVDPGWQGARVAFLGERGKGTWAEEIVVPASYLARVPEAVDWPTAGALPLAGLSAWLSLFDAGEVNPGDKVLIHAAAGGVGHIAVQLARAAGAQVWGTCSARNAGFVAGLGAEPVAYDEVDFEEVLSDLDLVLDTLGGMIHARSCRVLRPGGHLVALNAAPFENVAEAHGVRFTLTTVRPEAAALQEMLDRVAAGHLPITRDTLPFTAFAEAQDRVAGGHTRGKLVLTLDD